MKGGRELEPQGTAARQVVLAANGGAKATPHIGRRSRSDDRLAALDGNSQNRAGNPRVFELRDPVLVLAEKAFSQKNRLRLT